MVEVFLDTAYAIALSSPADQFHTQAVQIAERIEVTGTLMVTTQAVLLEIGNALSKQRYRSAALEADPSADIVPLSEALYANAFCLFRERLDKEWGLVECVSFIVMRRGITDALTTDEHFKQIGFRVLLREQNP